MKLLERILVATDFGRAAEDAVEMAIYTACRFESKVYLLHARQDEDTAESSSGVDAISERLDAIAERMVEQGVRHVESVVVVGPEADKISSYAEQEDVNLIVIGAGEMSPEGQQVYLGTTAASLRRWSSKPVCIVRPGMAPPIRRILCPVDLLPASSRALYNAIHFARAFDAELAVLLVVKLPLEDADESGPLLEFDADSLPESREPHLPEYDQFLAKFDFHQVRSAKLIRQGKPRQEIVQAAQEISPDLIVMGSTGRQGMSRMLIGGVARRVAQVLPCSIITVREQTPIKLTLDSEVPPLDAESCASHPTGQQCKRYQHGVKLLEMGLAEEAATHFLTCVLEYSLCVHAWRRLAEANVRVGRPEEARRCEQNALEALRRQENKMIEEDARGSHILHRRIFGI